MGAEAVEITMIPPGVSGIVDPESPAAIAAARILERRRAAVAPVPVQTSAPHAAPKEDQVAKTRKPGRCSKCGEPGHRATTCGRDAAEPKAPKPIKVRTKAVTSVDGAQLAPGGVTLYVHGHRVSIAPAGDGLSIQVRRE